MKVVEPGDGLEPSRRWFRANASTPENPGVCVCRGDGEDSNLATTPVQAVTISPRLVSNEQMLVMAFRCSATELRPHVDWFARRDSNPHWTAFEAAVSPDWTTHEITVSRRLAHGERRVG